MTDLNKMKVVSRIYSNELVRWEIHVQTELCGLNREISLKFIYLSIQLAWYVMLRMLVLQMYLHSNSDSNLHATVMLDRKRSEEHCLNVVMWFDSNVVITLHYNVP